MVLQVQEYESTIEKEFHYYEATPRNYADHDDDNKARRELNLMMIGCEGSNIYGPNENIGVSHGGVCVRRGHRLPATGAISLL